MSDPLTREQIQFAARMFEKWLFRLKAENDSFLFGRLL